MQKTFIIAAFGTAAILGMSSAAISADDMMSSSAEMATMVCRPAHGHEKATAMMADKKALVCKSVDTEKMMHQPMKAGMTPAEVESAWEKALKHTFTLSKVGG